jgi:hypothetical protein
MVRSDAGWARSIVVSGAVAAAATAAAVAPARADRPFIATTSAAAEEDDDRVWAIAGWARRDKLIGEVGIEAEYAFEPRLSAQFGLVRSRPRATGAETTLEAEAEFKWLYNHIARDSWGIGINLGLGASREGDAAWRGGSWSVTVPFSWQWSEGGGLLHLNAGVARERGQRRESMVSAAAEVPLASRWTAFAEAFKGGDERLAQVGVRWWLKRERLALDLAAVQRRPEGGGSTTGWVFGLSVLDL